MAETTADTTNTSAETSSPSDLPTDNKVVTRPLTQQEKGQPRIVSSSRWVNEVSKRELLMPNRLCVYKNMYDTDEAVTHAVEATNNPVRLSLYNGEFVSNSGSSASKAVADFLNYNIHTMPFGSWFEYVNNAVTALTNGFSIQNIVTRLETDGPYKGLRTLKKLAPRSQQSVYGWVWDKNLREYQGFVQKPNIRRLRDPKMSGFNGRIPLNDLITPTQYQDNYPFLRKEQITHFAYNQTDNNPEGDSPLGHCYKSYLEKVLVSEYEVVGVSKDLGGLLILRVPSQLIERANDAANYPNEAQEYSDLQKDAGALHAGEQSFIMLTSDVDPVTKVKDYDLELKGIDGGGKQYTTTAIIQEKNKGIYNAFGAGHLLLGQNGTGSYALSTSQTSTHGLYTQRDIMFYANVINKQLIPTLLRVNNIELDWRDIPVFKPADPDELDWDVLSKTIQRMKSVGGLTKEATEYMYKRAGLPLDGIDELMFDDGDTSRGGESNGTSGTGSSQDGGVASTVNAENGGSVDKAVKKFVVDGDRIINTATDKVVNLEDLDESGNYKE